MPLNIANDLALPDNAVTQTFGFLARKGAGKTYAAGKLVEELLELRAPVVVLDPVGTWYGLRIGADGKSLGASVPVFGGEHGDVPIDVHQGEAVARLVVQRTLSAVIDVSGFRKNERKRFVTDFAETLFHESKRVRSARMVVLEEAQVFAPQQARGEERMLGAIEDIVRLGRNYGLGSTLISQRPQSVNKEVLNQVEALFVGQLSGPHERKAIEAWVTERGADKDWLKRLPSLPVGTMVLWSPQWLQVFREVKIGKKRTLDASATPELGKVRQVSPPIALDVDELRAALSDEPPENSTKSPRRNQTTAAQPDADSLIAENAQLRAANEDLNALNRALTERVAMVADQLIAAAEEYVSKLHSIRGPLLGEGLQLRAAPPRPGAETSVSRAPRVKPAAAAALASTSNGALSAPQRAILETLAELHPLPFTRVQLAKARGCHIRSKGHTNNLGALSSGGYIEKAGDLVQLTSKGANAIGHAFAVLQRPTREQRRAFWDTRLSSTERAIINYALTPLHKDALAAELGVHPRSKGFCNALGSLRSAGLVTKGSTVALTPYMLGRSA